MMPLDEYFIGCRLSPQQMDALWAAGWRHFGSYFFRYSHLMQGGSCYHVLPLRVRLEAFQLSRSQRRVLNRNRDLALRITPAFVDAAVLALFERHKRRFRANVPSSLYTFISEDPAQVPCRCLALCCYLAGELVGISYLDVGELASSSVYQCFEPSLKRRSLGIYLILAAIRYSQALGKRWYYPGYAYREPSHYDYKKAFSGLEAFDWQRWRPYDNSTAFSLP